MDLFQRLLGTLQRTVDYISIFTTYLLGDEAHPRAEGSGSTRETVPHGSHHDCDVETAHHGDISPGGDLKAFKGPPNSETSPPNQESQEASGKDFTSAQAAEAILRAAGLPCKDEGWEDVGQKLSEPPNFLADAPKPRSSTMGSIQQRDLGGPTVTGGLHEWEPEGSARMGFVQQEQLEEMADVKDWEPEKPLAGGQEHEELGRAGEAEGTWQKEQKETEGDEQEAPGGAESDGEEQMGLDGAAWAGGFQQQVANMVEDLRSEPDGELLGGADTEDSQQEEPDIEAGDEGVQPAVPDSAKTRGLEDKAEARSSLQWEPEETVTLELQEDDPKGVTEKGGGQQRGLEEAGMEAPQQGGPEGFVRSEGTQWRKQEENEGDEQEATGGAESDGEEQMGLDGAAWAGGFQQQVANMVEDLRSDPDGELVGGANTEDSQQEEPEPAVLDSAETRGLEDKAEARISPRWEPETVTLEVQEDDPKGVTEKGGGQQRGLEEAGMEAPQQGGAEGFVRSEGTQWRGQEENEEDEQEATGGEESVMEEQRGALTRGPEDEAEARSSPQWEPEEMMTFEVQDDPKGVTEKGGGQQRGLEEAGMEAPQQGVAEGFVRSEGTQWRGQEENEGDEQEATGGEESVMEEQRRASTGRFQQEVAEGSEGQCLEAEGQLSGGSEAESCQQGEPHRETKDEGSQPTMLEGAETGGDQQGGPEGEAEVGRSLLWEPEKTGTLGEHLEKGNGQQQGLEGTEGGEGHQHGKAGGLARHEAAMEEEGQEEQMGEPHLERDQQTDPEASAGVSVFEAVVATAMSGEPEGQGQEPQGTEGTERSLPHEPLGDTALVDARCFTGTGAFPDEGPSLDTRAQKERVLLRRKSSIRRAPSLKRSRPPTETPPPQESGIEENSPSQPPSSGRPNLRHAGFGPMHPNMMAELQMRLRRPQ